MAAGSGGGSGSSGSGGSGGGSSGSSSSSRSRGSGGSSGGSCSGSNNGCSSKVVHSLYQTVVFIRQLLELGGIETCSGPRAVLALVSVLDMLLVLQQTAAAPRCRSARS